MVVQLFYLELPELVDGVYPAHAKPSAGLEDATGLSWLEIGYNDPMIATRTAIVVEPCAVGSCPSENCGCDRLVTAERATSLVGNSFYLDCPSELAGPDQQFAVCGDCPDGYSGNGLVGCTETDECSYDLTEAVCDPITACENTAGGFICSSCPTGFFGDGTVALGGCTQCGELQRCSLVHCADAGDIACLQCDEGFGAAGALEEEGCSSCTAATADGAGLPFTNETAAAIENEMLAVQPFLIEWQNCPEHPEEEFCRDMFTSSGASTFVCLPCFDDACEDTGLCGGSLRSLGGANIISSSRCPGGHVPVAESDQLYQLGESSCFGGQGALYVRESLMVYLTKNYFGEAIELRISGSITPTLAAYAGNKTVVEYRDCGLRGFRVSLCNPAEAFALHHLIVVSDSPGLQQFTVEPDTGRDSAALGGIAPGSSIGIVTYTTGDCLSERRHRRIFDEVRQRLRVPEEAEAAGLDDACDGDDPEGIIAASGQDCQQVCVITLVVAVVDSFFSSTLPSNTALCSPLLILETLELCCTIFVLCQVFASVEQFGMWADVCSTPLAGMLAQLLGLSNVAVPAATEAAGTFASICPATCDGCDACDDDQAGALPHGHSCAEVLSTVQIFHFGCDTPIQMVSQVLGLAGIHLPPSENDKTIAELCARTCGVCR